MHSQFSYQGASNQALDFFLFVAHQGRALTPVYSGDIALAFQVSHRFVKDMIERYYSSLRLCYGSRVYLVRHKRQGCARAMHGYVLPMKAVLQLLTQVEWNGWHLLGTPEMLHTCFADGWYTASLN